MSGRGSGRTREGKGRREEREEGTISQSDSRSGRQEKERETKQEVEQVSVCLSLKPQQRIRSLTSVESSSVVLWESGRTDSFHLLSSSLFASLARHLVTHSFRFVLSVSAHMPLLSFSVSPFVPRKPSNHTLSLSSSHRRHSRKSRRRTT